MGDSFNRAGRFSQGYSVQEVDAFLADARAGYEGDDASFDPSQISTVQFSLERGGYDMGSVDATLDRLTDAFALRRRDEAIDRMGEGAWNAHLSERAEEVKERLNRPDGERFRPAEEGERSYDRDDVDDLCIALQAYFNDGLAMSVDDVRRAIFRERKGADGYDEAVVDVYLNHVADIMASVP